MVKSTVMRIENNDGKQVWTYLSSLGFDHKQKRNLQHLRSKIREGSVNEDPGVYYLRFCRKSFTEGSGVEGTCKQGCFGDSLFPWPPSYKQVLEWEWNNPARNNDEPQYNSASLEESLFGRIETGDLQILFKLGDLVGKKARENAEKKQSRFNHGEVLQDDVDWQESNYKIYSVIKVFPDQDAPNGFSCLSISCFKCNKYTWDFSENLHVSFRNNKVFITVGLPGAGGEKVFNGQPSICFSLNEKVINPEKLELIEDASHYLKGYLNYYIESK